VTAPGDDLLAARLRGFGLVGVLAILVILAGNLLIPPLSAVLVLLWAQRSRTPWREIGYVWPERWLRTVAIGLAFGIAFKLVMKAIVMPLLGAPPINAAYHYFGAIFAVTGRIWLLMVAHAAFDLTAVALIYGNLESAVAHLIWAR